MTCKQCGTDEDRLKGFCSIECRDKFDYEQEKQYLISYIKAWMITELNKPTQEILDKEIAMIVSGQTSEDDKHTIAMFEAEQ